MKTLIELLAKITSLCANINEINSNYQMGFLTPTEFTSQLQAALVQIEAVRKAIREEYDINDNAISLMLMMN